MLVLMLVLMLMSMLMRNDIRFSLLLLHNYMIKFISISLLAKYRR